VSGIRLRRWILLVCNKFVGVGISVCEQECDDARGIGVGVSDVFL
jgi:hypothetical protein